MEKTSPLVITISRQKGCGGAYLGQKLAQALNILYLDRELVADIAQKLDEPIEFVEANEERIRPLWESVVESLSWSYPWLYNPPPPHVPVFQVSQLENQTIVKVASEKPVVIVGRGSSYLLRDHPKHISFLLYACKQWRIKRTEEIYSMPHHDAVKLIEKSDVERARYNKALSGADMFDATQFNLALDTGVTGLDNAEAILLEYVRIRYPEYR